MNVPRSFLDTFLSIRDERLSLVMTLLDEVNGVTSSGPP